MRAAPASCPRMLSGPSVAGRGVPGLVPVVFACLRLEEKVGAPQEPYGCNAGGADGASRDGCC